MRNYLKTPRWGDPVSAEQNAQVVRLAQGFLRSSGPGLATSYDGLAFVPQLEDRPWYGIIESAGPASESDWTDERYWVRSAFCDGGTGGTDAATMSEDDASWDGAMWETATNLAEISTHSHSVPAGSIVQVWREYSPGPVTHWVFLRRGGIPVVVDGVNRVDEFNHATVYAATHDVVLDFKATGHEQRLLIHTKKPFGLPLKISDILLTGTYHQIAASNPNANWTGHAGNRYFGIVVACFAVLTDWDPTKVTWDTVLTRDTHNLFPNFMAGDGIHVATCMVAGDAMPDGAFFAESYDTVGTHDQHLEVGQPPNTLTCYGLELRWYLSDGGAVDEVDVMTGAASIGNVKFSGF